MVVVDSSEKHFATVFDLWCFVNDNAQGSHCYFVSPDDCVVSINLAHDVDSTRNFEHFSTFISRSGSGYFRLTRNEDELKLILNDPIVISKSREKGKEEVKMDLNQFPKEESLLGRSLLSDIESPNLSHIILNSKSMGSAHMELMPSLRGMAQIMHPAVSQAFDISSKAEMGLEMPAIMDYRSLTLPINIGVESAHMERMQSSLIDMAQTISAVSPTAVKIRPAGSFAADAYISEIKERREHEETMEDLAQQGLEMHQEAIDKQEIQEKEKEQLIENAVARGVSEVISKLDKDNVIVKDNEVKIKDSKRCINEGGDKYYMSDNIKVFISYCSEDGVQSAKELKNILNTKDGVGCFFAQDDILYGDDLLGKMDEALNSMNVFIPIMTAQYSQSKWCMYELGYARRRQNQDNNISIVPIKVGNEPDKDFLFGKYIDWDEIRESADTRDVAEVAAEFIEKVIDRKHRPRE